MQRLGPESLGEENGKESGAKKKVLPESKDYETERPQKGFLCQRSCFAWDAGREAKGGGGRDNGHPRRDDEGGRANRVNSRENVVPSP